MNYKFYFHGIPKWTHTYMYSSLVGWNNERESILVDFKNCDYNLFKWADETVCDILIYHINLAVVHGLIDQNMFYGECKKEGWDPKHFWNIKLILGMGMGDWSIHTFDELFEYDKKPSPKRIFVEYNHKTGRMERPRHYYRKKSKH